MAQVCLLDSNRLSKLLHEALPWSPAVNSLLVSARNGSILAYAFRADCPSIKDIRTLSTTMSAAYKAASENTLIYESQKSGSISVIGSVADHVLLAVSGAGPGKAKAANDTSRPHENVPRLINAPDRDVEESAGDHEEEDEGEEAKAHVRSELESVSEELAAVLRDELRDMKWPDDI